ncbi:Polysaccharide biosynthesis/export protein [Tsuneonella dongtanensis]|uniref:Polysaccharide biosynthesis/export protein n=1 Tax=Tsuneonella dongtanensis TaxID=692370 RepID=A0A1B2AB91_9SPHN|nr:polysaccharide biosynthesis/export family protein [Tsuneonella dongtanensis]ANY19429.1 Polysaccharide biosynthesis/export protein [Tsuneonella dongtanensis]
MIHISAMRGIVVSLVCAGALGACGATPPPVVGVISPASVEADGQQAFTAESAPADYRLRPSDSIGVTVFREPELSLAATPIGADGSIALPLIGSIRAEGRTAAELSGAIESELRRGYLNDPRVSVNVLRYDSHRVTVEGAVKTPGVYPFNPGSRLSSAIALAQGPDRVAKLDQIAIFRPTTAGMTVAKFDYRAIQEGTMIDPIIQPDDRVVVGTSGLSQFWQDTLKAIPVFALFTRI